MPPSAIRGHCAALIEMRSTVITLLTDDAIVLTVDACQCADYLYDAPLPYLGARRECVRGTCVGLPRLARSAPRRA